ncbi:MAG: hypothetical protein KIS96_03595 [Bauldia sp.]|nr:hypothetical protein [Bauldia sp.]
MTIRFYSGRAYCTRSVVDHDTIVRIEVARRTLHTITTTQGKRLRVRIVDGVEQVMPQGNHSMAPVIGADDPEHIEVVELQPRPPKAKSGPANDNAAPARFRTERRGEYDFAVLGPNYPDASGAVRGRLTVCTTDGRDDADMIAAALNAYGPARLWPHDRLLATVEG